MSVLRHEIRPGAYADSIVLMHLQSSLAALPGVEEAGVAMGTPANLELLAANGLLIPEVERAAADDLVLVVRAFTEAAAAAALARVDELLAARRGGGDAEFRPHSLRSAVRLLPRAGWVLVSVPGRYAARVADEALELGKHVFLYSDNVALDDEVALKRKGRDAGLLVMGPDCGTALVGGFGLGFANRVRRGGIGLVGASGTGLQTITCAIHAAGAGVSHALGTGGRDLSPRVGGVTALAGLELLRRDPATEVIVLVSKPPAPEVAERLLEAAERAGKPVVVRFIGHSAQPRARGNLHFGASLSDAARLAVALAGGGAAESGAPAGGPESEPRPGLLRGLFAGGTLALEAQQVLAGLEPLCSNVPILGSRPIASGRAAGGSTSPQEGASDLHHAPLAVQAPSGAHAIVDLGADEYTVGRLHPMIDQELRLEELRRQAGDPEVGVILLDVVLGEGAHPDPAAELAPAVAELTRGDAAGSPVHRGQRDGGPEVVIVLVGTDRDPQNLDEQRRRLTAAGARVFLDVAEGFAYVAARFGLAPPPASPPPAAASGRSAGDPPDGQSASQSDGPLNGPGPLDAPFAAINVGLDSFYDSLVEQGAEAVQLDWRPPAGGDERLMALLERMR